MLDALRNQSQSPWGKSLLVLLFGFLALSFFITFGPSGRFFDPVKASDYAAKVNGEEISRQDFERYYYRQIRQFGQLDAATVDRILPRSRVLDEMVKDRLVAEAALTEGIDVADSEIREVILKDPSFEEDGKFSGERYRLVVERSLGMTVDQYEDELRRALRAQKMGALLRETAKVSDDELGRKYAEQNDKVNLRYVRFSPAFYTAGISVKPEEVQALIKEHMDQVQAAYEKQKTLYHSPKSVQASHLLIKLPAGPAAADAEQVARGRLLKLKEDVEKGTSFATVARGQSQAGDAAQGGALGLIKAGGHLFDPALEQAALGLEQGKVSDPVRTKAGLELVYADQVIAAQDHPLDEVKETVARDVILHDRAVAQAEAAAKAAQSAAASKGLESLYPATAEGAPAAPSPNHPVSETTGLFARSGQGYLPKIGPAAELQKEAFDAPVQAPGTGRLLPGPTRQGEAFVVAEVIEHQKADPAAFAKSKDELRENELRRTEVQLMQSLRSRLRSQAVVEINNAALAVQTNRG